MLSREYGWSLQERYFVPSLSFFSNMLWALGWLRSTPCLVCWPRSVKEMYHMGKKNNNTTLGWTNTLIDIQLQLLKTLPGCLEIVFLNVMGFGSFNHVMNIYFFLHLFIIGRNWVMDFSTDAPVPVYFSIAPVSIVIWQCKTRGVRLIYRGNTPLKEFSSVTIISTKMQNREWQNDWFYLHFGIFLFEWQPWWTQFSR